MQQFKPYITRTLWILAFGFAVYNSLTGSNFGLSAVEGLMVLIAAFVAHKTLDLLMPSKNQSNSE